MMIDEEDYQPSNRQKGKSASYGEFWCFTCDRYFGGQIGKCPVCGKKMNERKVKYDRKRSSFNT